MLEQNKPRRPLRVLVIDDEKNILTTLTVCLEGMGCAVTAVSSPQAALSALTRQVFDLAFLDLRLREANGLELLPTLLQESPALAVVIITAYANFDTAVQAIKLGAMDYLPKPFTPAQIRHVVEQVTERHAMQRRVADLEGKLAESVPETDLTTESPKMQAILAVLNRAAASDTAVLLRGESGTGKGVLARRVRAPGIRSSW